MKLSVACTFAPGLISRLACFPQVEEVYGKLDRDVVGGGRSTYTLRKISRRHVLKTIEEAHAAGIAFNYLLNGASLGGREQTRAGQRAIRQLLDFLSDARVDAVTVASPLLARTIRRCYPHFRIRASAFSMVDSVATARQWQDVGVDTICLSAIACNRDFDRLEQIRRAVSCELQLIVNASCLTGCAYEPTHMHLLTQSSRSGDPTGGFCVDYCALHCTQRRLQSPADFIRACWIRPEDLHAYEALGFESFKILERSCPTDLLVKRVSAYASREFEGNLYELVAPVASIKKELDATPYQRLRILLSMLKPHKLRIRSLRRIRAYMKAALVHEFTGPRAPIRIDNKGLSGFLEEVRKRDCGRNDCRVCGYCESVGARVVTIDAAYREEVLRMGSQLNEDFERGSLWFADPHGSRT